MILSCKEFLKDTLEFYDVNRVQIYSVDRFLEMAPSLPSSAIWGIRSINPLGGGGRFDHAVSTSDAVKILKRLNGDLQNFIICESMKFFDDNHLDCNGEVQIYKDEFNTWAYKGFLNRTPGLNVRVAANSVTAGGVGYDSITSRHQVPGILFDEMWAKGIVNSVVEFSIYDCPVGIKKNPLLFWEIRRY